MINDKLNGPCDGGQPVKSDEQAAGALAQGHDKSRKVPQAWGQKDQQNATTYSGRKQ